MKAVILATEEDVGLLPITATRPKHLIKIAGKPIIQHCLEALKKAGITDALIVTRHLDKAIQEYLGDGQQFGPRLNYIEQHSMLGTGNAANTRARGLARERSAEMCHYGERGRSAGSNKTRSDNRLASQRRVDRIPKSKCHCPRLIDLFGEYR